MRLQAADVVPRQPSMGDAGGSIPPDGTNNEQRFVCESPA
jgi:hypothetical protein